ncbi:hypothetical protein JCM16303_006297 [Sporobolomyces ruberrimus]
MFTVGGQGINIHDIIRIGKKLFTFYKKWNKKHQQQQQQQQHQQQQQYSQQYPQQQNPYQGGGGYNNNQSPYPPAVGHAQPQQNTWNQPHQQQPQQIHGGYGAHDGKPTKKLTRFPSPSPLLFTNRSRPLLSTFALSPFSNAYRIPNAIPPPFLIPSLFAAPATSSFSTSSHSSLPRRPPWPLFDPSSSFPAPSHRRPLLPSLPTDPPPPRQPRTVKLSIFHLLPAFLRPSYKTLLRIDDDILVHFDEDVADQNYDMSNAQNAHYVELRNKAIHEGDLMAKCFSDSQRAYTSGNGEAAHQLSLEGKEHQRLKDQYNDQAAEWIFNENNKVQPRGSVDLHGLYVQESIEFTERAIDNARNQGLEELRVIVGKGNHSPSHVAKLKPAITSLMSRKRLTAHLDPHNNGVLVVQLQQQGVSGRNGVREIRGGDEMVRSIGEKEDGGCLIM